LIDSQKPASAKDVRAVPFRYLFFITLTRKAKVKIVCRKLPVNFRLSNRRVIQLNAELCRNAKFFDA